MSASERRRSAAGGALRSPGRGLVAVAALLVAVAGRAAFGQGGNFDGFGHLNDARPAAAR